MTIDVNFIANFSTNDTISSNNFRVCVNAYPIVTNALYNYCNAGVMKVCVCVVVLCSCC